MTRRQFLASATATTATAALSGPLSAAAPKNPNIVIILADDMGFSDARCYGGDIDTPNLDRLAANGLRFTQAYSTARCGPSRNCLLTGQYAQQNAADIMTPGNIPAYIRFLPEYVKPQGYRTYHSGKWHMRFQPLAGIGFDRSYTMLDEDRYFTQKRHQLDGVELPPPPPNYYSTTAIADYSVQFLKDHQREHAGKPFLLYMTPHAPHFPLQAKSEDIALYKDRFSEGWDVARDKKWKRMTKMGLINCPLAPLEPNMWTKWNTPDAELTAKIGPGEVMRAVPWSTLTPEQKEFQRTKMAIHAAMVTRIDMEIGKLLKQIDEMGATRDTCVIFLSDNGASSEQLIRGDGHDKTAPSGSAQSFLGLGPGWASNSNAPFRLHKSWVNEGGVASPMIVHWPAGIAKKNELRHDPCHFIDLLPTVVDLAGGSLEQAKEAPPLPGRSMRPAFGKDGAAPKPYIYFNHNDNHALRVGDWKLISTGVGGPWELYNLKTDRAEQKDLASAQPDRVKAMAAQWKALDDDFVQKREAAAPSKRPRLAAAPRA